MCCRFELYLSTLLNIPNEMQLHLLGAPKTNRQTTLETHQAPKIERFPNINHLFRMGPLPLLNIQVKFEICSCKWLSCFSDDLATNGFSFSHQSDSIQDFWCVLVRIQCLYTRTRELAYNICGRLCNPILPISYSNKVMFCHGIYEMETKSNVYRNQSQLQLPPHCIRQWQNKYIIVFATWSELVM